MIGKVIGHWIMGMELTIMSLLGMLALIVVVVNDSLVLVDFINKNRAEGMKLIDSILIAGASVFLSGNTNKFSYLYWSNAAILGNQHKHNSLFQWQYQLALAYYSLLSLP